MPNHPVPDKKTVMVCDDERDLLLLFGLALGPKYNVIQVGSGKDCIDKFIKEKNRGIGLQIGRYVWRFCGSYDKTI